MSKYITHFQTESAYQAALPSIVPPNVSLVDELGEVHYHRALYGAHTGDICLYDVAEGQKFFVTANDWNLTSYPTASYPIVGIAIADEGASGVIVTSTFLMTADGSPSTTWKMLKWQNTAFDWGLTKYSTSNEAKTDFNGKSNTATIIAAIKAYDLAHSTDNLTGCIGGAIQAFAVTGTAAGDWYIGAAGENDYLNTNITVISASLDKINTASSSLGLSSAVYYKGSYASNTTSSSEKTLSNFWGNRFEGNSYRYNIADNQKTSEISVPHPFLKLT